MLPAGFTYLEDPRIIRTMAYCTHDNFMGRPVKGYERQVCILSNQAHDALIAVQNELDSLGRGYHLRIFDAYRPTTACSDFLHWSKDPKQKEMERIYYPNVLKETLFEQGYIAEKSTHSRGSTVDLTICVRDRSTVDLHDAKDLDMGTVIDFFDELTHTANPNISEIAKKNRALLKDLMAKQGFINYPLEWWHFTLDNEPFPDTYFDFPVR